MAQISQQKHPKPCPKCGQANPSNYKNCAMCHSKLDAGTPVAKDEAASKSATNATS